MTSGRAYYNEIDPFAAAWLRELIKAGQIPDGEVDTRSITDVRGSDLAGFRHCHFFAGIGGWAYALRLAGWPDDREVWTGSCPCQPWSVAGASAGTDDPRHLWPAWFPLIRERRPRAIFGEQTASTDGEYWIDLVSVDLESEDYAFGPFDLPACGVGAPHARQRFYFVADDNRAGRGRLETSRVQQRRTRARGGQSAAGGADRAQRHGAIGRGEPSSLADAGRVGRQAGARATEGRQAGNGADNDGDMGDADNAGPQGHAGHVSDGYQPGWFDAHADGPITAAGATRGFWSGAEWVRCVEPDGTVKTRPVEPGTFPLAHVIPARVGRLRGYGNAIVAELAAEFIRAYQDLNRC